MAIKSFYELLEECKKESNTETIDWDVNEDDDEFWEDEEFE